MERLVQQLKTSALEKHTPNSSKDAVVVLIDIPELQAAAFAMAYCTRNHPERDTFFHIMKSFGESLGNPQRGVHLLRHFERTLADLNAALALLQKPEGLSFNQCHALFGIALQNQLFLSHFGSISLLFLHKTEGKRFSVYELHDEEEHDGWKKAFVTIFDGEFHHGDVFFAKVSDNQESLHSDDMLNIITTLPPQSALSRLQQFSPPMSPFCAMIIAFEQHQTKTKLANEHPITSVHTLLESKERTETYLEERGMNSATAITQALKSSIAQLRKPGIRGPWETTRRFFGLMAAFFVEAISRCTRLLHKKRLPRITLFLAVPLVIGIGVWAVLFFQRTQKNAAFERSLLSSLNNIEEQVVAADAGRIYGNTKAAEQNIHDALTALAALTAQSAKDQEKINAMRERIQQVYDRLQGITPVSPNVLAKKNGDEQPFAGLISLQGEVVAITKSKHVYTVNDTNEVALEQKNISLDPFGSIVKALPLSDGGILLWDSSGQLGKITSGFSSFSLVSSGVSSITPNDIALYNDVLYALRADTEQVVKFSAVEGGYAQTGTPWIVAKTSSLTSAQALAIDGKVYVATPDGIAQFLSGKQQPWEMSTISPALQQAKLWTSAQTTTLYILDAQHSRLITVDKNSGKVLAQYKSDKLTNATDFLVDEENHRILFTDNDTLYVFSTTE
jgi:GAF domain-containing protein